MDIAMHRKTLAKHSIVKFDNVLSRIIKRISDSFLVVQALDFLLDVFGQHY